MGPNVSVSVLVFSALTGNLRSVDLGNGVSRCTNGIKRRLRGRGMRIGLKDGLLSLPSKGDVAEGDREGAARDAPISSAGAGRAQSDRPPLACRPSPPRGGD